MAVLTRTAIAAPPCGCAQGWTCSDHDGQPFAHDGCAGAGVRCQSALCPYWQPVVGTRQRLALDRPFSQIRASGGAKAPPDTDSAIQRASREIVVGRAGFAAVCESLPRARPATWLEGDAAFLDEEAIDEFIITVVPTFIGEGIPPIAPRHLNVPLRLIGVRQFPDGAVQPQYEVQRSHV